MSHWLTQFFMALFGLAAMWMAMGSTNPRMHKWAPIVGLIGQPFWLLFAGASALFFAVGEWRARKHDARQTLAERMTELRAQGPLPPWAAGIEARQASSVVERRNAPQKRGLLARLDDWMGL